MKLEIVKVIKKAKQAGIPKYKSCGLLQVNSRRVERWMFSMRYTGNIEYKKSGPRYPRNAIMPVERNELIEYVELEKTVDYSLQTIAIKGAEEGLFYMSASSVRKILHEENMGMDRQHIQRNNNLNKPARPEELNGPNQCWCWDISYIRTDILRVFWYLYVMIDEWSRKVVAWRISDSLSEQEALILIDDAFLSEDLINQSDDNLPVIVNDRGSQMKAKKVQQTFKDLGLPQTFARPRTPNDNPFVESFFSTVKTSPVYPGWFPNSDIKHVKDYFNIFFTRYNKEHYHSRIGYVTPVQKHNGLDKEIIEQRKTELAAQHEIRKKYWQSQQLTGDGL